MIYPCRVVKFGGSLFARDDYASAFVAWLRRRSTIHCVIVTGGGVWADAVRQLDQQHGLSTSTAHWMAIRAMSMTSWLLACSAQQLQYVDRFATLRDRLSQREPARVVFDVAHFLQHEEPSQLGIPLPQGWHVTSDSIAARLAHLLSARELILLKSTPTSSIRAAARDGIVDTYFATAAAAIHSIRIETMG